MIKVLHIGHSRKWRGGENQVRLLIQGMRAKGYHVEHYIAYPDGARMIERMADQVSAVLKLPSTRPYDPRCVLAMIRFSRQHNINLLNAHSGSAHSLAYYARFSLPDVKLVVHRRVNFTIKNAYFTRKKYSSAKVDHYVAISSAIRNNLLGYGIPADKISLVKSAVDHRPYIAQSKESVKQSWCERYGWDPNQPLLGFASALDSTKDPMLFVQTVSELRQRGYNVNALIAGRGSLEGQLESEIQRCGLQQFVKLTGFIEDMPGLFPAFDIFFLPSKEEGLGTVLLEAIHSGCAVAASDAGGIGEIIRQGETGMLAKPGDVAGFIDAAEALLGSEELRTRIIANAAQHVNRSFSLAKLLLLNYKVYQRLNECHHNDAALS